MTVYKSGRTPDEVDARPGKVVVVLSAATDDGHLTGSVAVTTDAPGAPRIFKIGSSHMYLLGLFDMLLKQMVSGDESAETAVFGVLDEIEEMIFARLD